MRVMSFHSLSLSFAVKVVKIPFITFHSFSKKSLASGTFRWSNCNDKSKRVVLCCSVSSRKTNGDKFSDILNLSSPARHWILCQAALWFPSSWNFSLLCWAHQLLCSLHSVVAVRGRPLRGRSAMILSPSLMCFTQSRTWLAPTQDTQGPAKIDQKYLQQICSLLKEIRSQHASERSHS
jgi:hypothetical protein